MKKLLFTLLSTAIFAASCKKESTAPPQQQVTVIDFDTRQGIANAQVSTYELVAVDYAYNNVYSTVPHQTLHTGVDGNASIDIIDGEARFFAPGYLKRAVDLITAKGNIELVKSAAIELEFVNTHLIPGSNLRISIECRPDPQVQAVYGSETILFYQDIQASNSPQIFSFSGVAGKINNLSIAYASLINSQQVQRDTVYKVIPALTGTTRVQFNY